jgi:type IV pilus assembly protein PilE
VLTHGPGGLQTVLNLLTLLTLKVGQPRDDPTSGALQPTDGVGPSAADPHNPCTMISNLPCLQPRAQQRGFTLIELMIAVVLVSILTAIAYPSFVDSIRRGRRSEAMAALASVQQAQERWRANHPAYAAGTLLSTAPPDGLGQPATSASGYYTIAILGDPDATTYAVTATAVNGGKQAADINCKVLGIDAQAGRIRYGGGTGTTPDWTDPNKCWAR